MLEALYEEGDSLGADVADCVRGVCPSFRLVGVKVPEPGAERSSLPNGLAIREKHRASDQRGKCEEHDCD
jgi:hypothetical protein